MLIGKKSNRITFTIFFLIILLFSSFSTLKQYIPPEYEKIISSPLSTPSPEVAGAKAYQSENLAKVIRVIDGDTIVLDNGYKLRYIGIDSPESVDPRTKVQCFSKEASIRNRELVLNKTIRLEKDVSNKDRYGRLLRYVYVDNILINELLVKEGFAFSSAYPPDIKYQNRFDAAEKTARANKNGLWGSCEN